MTPDPEKEWRDARCTLARAIDLTLDACHDLNDRKVQLFWGLAEAEIDRAVAARGIMLRLVEVTA